MSSANKPNMGFWIIAVIGLLWNLYGVYLFINDTFLLTPEMLSAYTEAQQNVLSDTPSWMAVVYGIATIAGFLGSILMVMRNKLALPLFGISLLAILINMGYSWFVLNSGEAMGMVLGYVIPLTVIIVGIFLYYYSKGATQKGWLR